MDENKKYIEGRAEWLERYGSYIERAKNWRLMAIGSTVVSAILALGLVHEASQTHIVPYVVQVDKLGQTVELAKAVRSGAYNQPVVTHIVARFITLARSRLIDTHAEDAYIKQVYDYAKGDAVAMLNSYFRRHNPFSAYQNNTGGRTVTITSLLLLDRHGNTGSYQVDWIEKFYSQTGNIVKKEHWQGIVNYEVTSPPNSTKLLAKNPFGIYITSFSWNKKQ